MGLVRRWLRHITSLLKRSVLMNHGCRRRMDHGGQETADAFIQRKAQFLED